MTTIHRFASNVDEGLRGYLTKYDCSSADINPIGELGWSVCLCSAFSDGMPPHGAIVDITLA